MKNTKLFIVSITLGLFTLGLFSDGVYAAQKTKATINCASPTNLAGNIRATVQGAFKFTAEDSSQTLVARSPKVAASIQQLRPKKSIFAGNFIAVGGYDKVGNKEYLHVGLLDSTPRPAGDMSLPETLAVLYVNFVNPAQASIEHNGKTYPLTCAVR